MFRRYGGTNIHPLKTSKETVFNLFLNPKQIYKEVDRRGRPSAYFSSIKYTRGETHKLIKITVLLMLIQLAYHLEVIW